jgi:hypothetical protein
MIGLCEKHPRYKAKRKPRVGCLVCWEIYRQTHPLFNMKKYIKKIIEERR